MKTIVINGNDFDNLASFYDEIEAKFTKDLDWKIGRNLDAVNDVLGGGFGVFDDDEEVQVIWINTRKSRSDFGYEATVEYYNQAKRQSHPSSILSIDNRISEAKRHEGATLFDMIVTIIKSHEHITFIEQQLTP